MKKVSVIAAAVAATLAAGSAFAEDAKMLPMLLKMAGKYTAMHR